MNWYLLWGLAAAVAWGSADFCAKRASTQFGFWPTVWGMNAVGALALAGMWAGGAIRLPAAQAGPLAGLAVGNAVGGVLFYFALEFGPLVLVSPITAAYPVVSAVLAYALAGERLGGAGLAAVGGVIAGTLLASLGADAGRQRHRRAGAALLAAVASALVFGGVFYALAERAGASPGAAPVLVFRLVGAAVLALPLLAGQRLPPGLFRSAWLWATGLLDSLAYLFYAEGARHLAVSVVAALSGLFSVWTLVLAVLFLRERLAPRQWLGVALILGAIALLALK
ncbi:MAG TPA: DMT family transporter [Terriglobales bacterium]|nr:DMT family transporter [Terriglobales bacterium]